MFFMHNPSPNRCLVFDLDTTLPFPTYFHKYVTETFRSDYAVSEDHHRYELFKKSISVMSMHVTRIHKESNFERELELNFFFHFLPPQKIVRVQIF